MLLQKTIDERPMLNATQKRRLESIDMLRGIALFGVFITHFICQFYGLSFPRSVAPAVLSTPIDAGLEKVLSYILFDKSRGMFSFLFGVGFYLQLNSALRAGIDFKSRFVKRYAILLVFGLLHYYFLFQGDVLRFYAILGIVLLLCYRLKPRVLLIASVMLTVVIPATCSVFENDLFIGNFNTPVFISIFGQFLFGYWVAQKKILQNLSAYRQQLTSLFTISLSVNVGLFLLRSALRIAAEKSLITDSPVLENVLGIAFFVGNQAMLLVFLSVIPLLYFNRWWRSRLTVFIIPGRMTLTNYLSQSVIAIALFKAGIFALLGTAAAFVMSIFLCIFQLYVSRWWLARFTAGPVEWLWRWATNLTWKPEVVRLTKPDIVERKKKAAPQSKEPALTSV